jgi:xylulokinase
MLCGLADAADALAASGVTPRRVVLTGGAARSTAIRQVAAGLFDLPVAVPEPAEYVALGAARQAAWMVAGGEALPTWALQETVVEPDRSSADYYRRVRESYAAVLSDAQPLLTR